MGNQPANPKPGDEEKGLRKFVSAVSEAVKDAAALQVLTFTGDVKSYIAPKTIDDKTKKTTSIALKWEDFFAAAVNDTEGKLSLVAATQVMLDGDTILFVSENPPPSLVDAHTEAVEAAQQYRQGLVTAFANIIGIAK